MHEALYYSPMQYNWYNICRALLTSFIYILSLRLYPLYLSGHLFVLLFGVCPIPAKTSRCLAICMRPMLRLLPMISCKSTKKVWNDKGFCKRKPWNVMCFNKKCVYLQENITINSNFDGWNPNTDFGCDLKTLLRSNRRMQTGKDTIRAFCAATRTSRSMSSCAAMLITRSSRLYRRNLASAIRVCSTDSTSPLPAAATVACGLTSSL